MWFAAMAAPTQIELWPRNTVNSLYIMISRNKKESPILYAAAHALHLFAETWDKEKHAV